MKRFTMRCVGCEIVFLHEIKFPRCFLSVFRTQKKQVLFTRARWTLKRLLPLFSVNSFEPVWIRVRLKNFERHDDTKIRIDVQNHQKKPLIEALFLADSIRYWLRMPIKSRLHHKVSETFFFRWHNKKNNKIVSVSHFHPSLISAFEKLC